MKNGNTEWFKVKGDIEFILEYTKLQEDDIKYLRHSSWTGSWGASVRIDECRNRINELFRMCKPVSSTGMQKGDRFVITIFTDPSNPILMKELPGIVKILKLFQNYGEVIFGFGTVEGHGPYIDISVIASKS